MSDQDKWADQTRQRLERIADQESMAPEWLRQVLRRMAANPADLRLAEEERPQQRHNFIYFH
jgi:hypothetical protein